MTEDLKVAVEPALEYVRGVLAGLYPEPANAMRCLTDEKIRDKALSKIENKIDIFETLEAACEEMLTHATRHSDNVEAAYKERNQVVAALAKCFPSGLGKTAIEGWDEAWHNCVYIDLPTGQASWHFHDRDAYLFNGLPQYKGKWDGHSTPEKYDRLNDLKSRAETVEILKVIVKKLEVIARVMNAAGNDLKPAEPMWHVDFCAAAEGRIRDQITALSGVIDGGL